MKLFCKGNHWGVTKENKLWLSGDARRAAQMEAVIVARTSMEIYNAICDLKLIENRKAIAKAGIDNVALTVQALCADVALGYISKKDGE